MIGQAATSGAGADPMAFTSDWHQWMIEDFARSLAENRPCLVTGEEALKGSCIDRRARAVFKIRYNLRGRGSVKDGVKTRDTGN